MTATTFLFLIAIFILCTTKSMSSSGNFKEVDSLDRCHDFFTLLVISRDDICIDVLRDYTEFFQVQSQQMSKMLSKLVIFIENLSPKHDHVLDDMKTMDCVKNYREEYMLTPLYRDDNTTTPNADSRNNNNIQFRYVNSTALFYEYQIPRKAIIAIDEWAHSTSNTKVESSRISDILRICLAKKFFYTYIDLDIIFNSRIVDDYSTPFISVRQLSIQSLSHSEYSVEFTNTAFCLSKQTLTNILKYQIYLIHYHYNVEFETSTKEVVKKRQTNQSSNGLESLFEGEDIELITTIKSIVTSKFKTSGGASTLFALRQQELGPDALFTVICNSKTPIRLISQNTPHEFSIKKLNHEVQNQGHLLTHLTCSSSKLRLHHISNTKIQFNEDNTEKKKQSPTYLQYVAKLENLHATNLNQSSLGLLKEIKMTSKITDELKSKGFMTVINEDLFNFKRTNSTKSNSKCTGLEQSLLEDIFSFTTSDLIKNFYSYYSSTITTTKVTIFVDKTLHCVEKIRKIINSVSTGIVGNFELTEYDATEILNMCRKKAASLYGRAIEESNSFSRSMVSVCLSAQYQMTYLSLQTLIVKTDDLSRYFHPFITMTTLIRANSAYLRKRSDPMADRLHPHSSISWHSYFLPPSIIYSGFYYHMQVLKKYEEKYNHRLLISKKSSKTSTLSKDKKKMKKRKVYNSVIPSYIDKSKPMHPLYFFDSIRKCLLNSKFPIQIYTTNNLGINNLKEIANEIAYYNHHMITIPLKSALQSAPSPTESDLIKERISKENNFVIKPTSKQLQKNSKHQAPEVKSRNKEKNSVKIFDDNVNDPIPSNLQYTPKKGFYWTLSDITKEILSYTHAPPVDIDAASNEQ